MELSCSVRTVIDVCFFSAGVDAAYESSDEVDEAEEEEEEELAATKAAAVVEDEGTQQRVGYN